MAEINMDRYKISTIIEKDSRRQVRHFYDGSSYTEFKSGVGVHFSPSSNAIVREYHTPDFKSLLYEIVGDGVTVDTTNLDMQNIDEFVTKCRIEEGSPISKTPQKIDFIINGNNNEINSNIAANVEVNGNSNIVKGSDFDDDIQVRGNSNELHLYAGNDKVIIDNGDNNITNLGRGWEKFSAPEDSTGNLVYRDTDGWDSIKNGEDQNPNHGIVGNVGNMIELGVNSTWSFIKTIPGKAEKALTDSWEALKDIGSSIQNWNPMRDRIREQKKDNEEYIINLDKYIENLQ